MGEPQLWHVSTVFGICDVWKGCHTSVADHMSDPFVGCALGNSAMQIHEGSGYKPKV